jgi:hypothetical protein
MSTADETDDGKKTKVDAPGRVSAFVSPEAKAMLEELAHRWFPNLGRPIGSALDRMIREAYRRDQGGYQRDLPSTFTSQPPSIRPRPMRRPYAEGDALAREGRARMARESSRPRAPRPGQARRNEEDSAEDR